MRLWNSYSLRLCDMISMACWYNILDRLWLPKGTDFPNVPDDDARAIEETVNFIQRKGNHSADFRRRLPQEAQECRVKSHPFGLAICPFHFPSFPGGRFAVAATMD